MRWVRHSVAGLEGGHHATVIHKRIQWCNRVKNPSGNGLVAVRHQHWRRLQPRPRPRGTRVPRWRVPVRKWRGGLAPSLIVNLALQEDPMKPRVSWDTLARGNSEGRPMVDEQIIEDRIMETVSRSPDCLIEELALECPGLTCNQIILADDRLSRHGPLLLSRKVAEVDASSVASRTTTQQLT